MDWDKLASQESLNKTVEKVKSNGVEVFVVENKQEAKKKVLELLPKAAEVMTMQSVSLKDTGVEEAINNSDNYKSVRNQLKSMDRATQGLEMQKLGAAPEWTVGSVHAVTEDGQIIVVSNTGSQLGAYAYGSPHVIWLVGVQKIARNLDEAMKRIYDYILPLESERLSQALGKRITSNVSKVLIINKEIKPDRATLILVKEKIGF